MDTVSISRFKATCLAVIRTVRRTGRPVLVTRFGQPIAEIVPPPPAEKPEKWLGCLAGSGRIAGDVISPAAEESEWEVLHP